MELITQYLYKKAKFLFAQLPPENDYVNPEATV